MSIIKDTFFGGAEKAASKKIVKAGEKAQEITREATEQAKTEARDLFSQAQGAGQQGFQGAIDVFGQFVPQQQQAFQGGNVAAQQQILATFPQIQNALLGGQVDLSGIQAFNPQQPDFGFLSQQLPQNNTGFFPNNTPVMGPLENNNILGGVQPVNNQASGLFSNLMNNIRNSTGAV